MIAKTKSLKSILLPVVLFLMFGAYTVPNAYSQESIQINVVNIPGVLPSPFLSDVENDVLGGRYQAQINYITEDITPIDVIFTIRLYKDGELLIEELSEPTALNPSMNVFAPIFDYIEMERSQTDVISDLDASLQWELIQTGTLPEGEYTFEIDAEPLDDDRRITINDGRAHFRVAHPQPPRIVSPADGANLDIETPVFSWIPVMGQEQFTIEYDIILVELFEGQSPEEAIDANRPHHEQTVIDATNFVYTNEFYPLEEGRTYAWQITANDVNDALPIKNDGESRVNTFTYRGVDTDPGDLADLEMIELVPEAAYLINLDQLDGDQIEETDTYYELNGEVEARLEMLDEPSVVADMQGLRIQKSDLENPVISGGSVHIYAEPLNDHFGENYLIEFEELNYVFGEGLNVEASIRTEFFGNLSTESELYITPDGLNGSLTALLEDLIEYRRDPVSLQVDEVTARFPEAELYADGSIQINGFDAPCSIQGLDINRDRLLSGFSCENLEPFPLVRGGGPLPTVENSHLLIVEPGFLRGEVRVDNRREMLSYDITKDAKITLNTDEDEDELCYTHFQTDFDSTEGVEVRPVDQQCDYLNNGLDLGFAEVYFRNPELDHLDMTTEDEGWDFELSFDTKLKVDLFDEWESPWMNNTVISRSGIEFQEYEFTRQSTDMPDFELADIQAHLQELVVEEFIYPVFDWDETGPGPWEVAFEGDISFPGDSNYPSCLSNAEAGLQNGLVTPEGVESDISVRTGDECKWEFGAGYAVEIESLTGQAGAEWGETGTDEDLPFDPYARFNLAGDFTTGDPFLCSDEATGRHVEIDVDGGLNAELENIHPDCPLEIGPFTADINESLLELEYVHGGGQQGLMGGDVSLSFSDNVQANGDITIDIMEGELKEGEIVIDGPFYWNIPTEDEILTFRIDEAIISEDGLFIDGRQEFVFGDEEMGVTFDQLLLDLQTREVKEGNIIFDERFALEAGIDQDHELSFNTLSVDSTTTYDPGLYMELGTTVTVDSSGIGTQGTADAEVFYDQHDFDSNVSVEYTDDFRMSLDPFQVSTGQADIFYNDSKIAFIDSEGFHPNLAHFADMLLPEKLPLPAESVAYIRLRDEDDELLVEGEQNDDGDYVISTLPDESLTLYVPAWDEGNPPEIVDVQLEDVVVGGDPSSPAMLEGSVIAEVPEDNELYNLTERDIPLQLDRLIYGDAKPGSDDEFARLYFEGRLNLFDEFLEEPNDVGFYLDHTGTIAADLQLSGFEQQIPLVPGSETVVYTLNELEGEFETSLDGLTEPDFSFDLSGLFEVNDAANVVASTALDLKYTQSSVNIDYYDGEVENLPHFDLGFFELNIDEINKFPEFSYTDEEGFSFQVGLDLDLYFNPAAGEPFHFPLSGVEIRDTGLVIPDQDIDASSKAGLDLPDFELMGMEFKPLAMRTTQEMVFDWYQQDWSFDLVPELDFELYLPEIQGTDINPPDGITFSNVGFEDGYLTGSVETHHPLSDVMVPLGPSSIDPPEIQVDSIGGSFESTVEDGDPQQDISVYAYSRITNLPRFEQPDDCPEEPDMQLGITEGGGLEGSIENYSPCGEVEMGPVALAVADASLFFSFEQGEQNVRADGTMEATLPAPDDQEITVTGNGEVDVITAQIIGGSIEIDQPFSLWYGQDDDPVFDLNMNQATLDSTGIAITGTGSAGSDDVSVDVTFDDLLFALPDFYIADGSATLESDLAFEVGTDLGAFTISDDEEDLEEDNALQYIADHQITLDPNGLSFTGVGIASLIYGGESFLDLAVNFEDGFSVDPTGSFIEATQGRAEFAITDEGDEYFDDEDPFVIWDPSGLSIGDGILAVLPDTLGLPVKDVAYVELTDEDGDPRLDINDLADGGKELTTGDDHLPIVIPALEQNGDDPPSVDAAFTVQTDSEYNLTGGSIALEDEGDLTPNLDLPVHLADLELSDEDGDLRLEASVRAELPSVFEDHQATGTLVLDESEGVEATIEAGTYTESWDDTLEDDYLYEYAHEDNLGGGEDDLFAARLYGIEMVIGASPALKFSAALQSSIISPGEEEDHTLFLTAAYDAGDWNAGAEYDWPSESTDFGLAEFMPEEHESISLDISEDQFVAGFNGVITFEEMLGEDFLIDIDDLQVGVDGIQSSPGLVFDIGEATAEMPDQEFDLFEGALAGEFSGIAVSVSQRALELSSEDGEIEFLEQQLEYDEFMISTAGEFGIENIGTDGFDLFEDYVALDGLGVSYEQEEGLELASNFTVTLPEPVDESAGASIMIARDDDGQISVEAEGPEFDYEDEKFALGDFGEFRLDDAGVGIEITEPLDSYFYANGAVLINDEERIEIGNKGNEVDEAGISYKPSRTPNPLRYNVKGNDQFEFDYHFFHITINADVAANNDGEDQSTFKLVLGGNAGINIDDVSGDLDYEGFTVTTDGVEDVGNFAGSGTLEIKDRFKLEVGSFFYEHEPDGMEVTIGSSEEVDTDDDTDVQDKIDEVEEETIEVSRILCFGDYPEIDPAGEDGCGSDNDALKLSLSGEDSDGGFSAGIGGLLFYETMNSGSRRIELDDIFLEIEETLEITGSMQYEDSPEGMMLRVSAVGYFELSEDGGELAAMIAGSIDNRDGLSFGLFAAAEAQDLAVPIIPGVLEMYGIGGGFFYNPVDDDIGFVRSAISDFGHEFVAEDKIPSSSGDLTGFAGMLYTSMGIAGSGGMYAIEASSYFQVTSQGLYIDASGTALGLDGDNTPGGLEATAGAYLSLELDLYDDPSFDEFLLQGGVTQEVFIPGYVEGDGEIHFFAGQTEQTDLVWGIQGEQHFSIYGGMLTSDATFLASDIGFFFEGSMTVGGALDDIPVVDFEASVLASVWYTTPESELDLLYPLGGYGEASAELCVIKCAEASIKGAFAEHQTEGLELFAAASAEILGSERSGWVTVTSGPNVDYGTGESDESELISEAQGYQDEFEDYIDDLLAELEETREAVEGFDFAENIPDEDDARRAGYRLYSKNSFQREAWVNEIRDNEERFGNQATNNMESILLFVENQGLTDSYTTPNYNDVDFKNSIIEFVDENIDMVSDDVLETLNNALEDAEEIQEKTETAYSDLLDVIQDSPVESWDTVAVGQYQNESPGYELDEDLANDQAEQTEDLEELMDEMGMAMIEPIQQVESLIHGMDEVMIQDSNPLELQGFVIDANPTPIGYARLYHSLTMMIDRATSAEANKSWVGAHSADNLTDIIHMIDVTDDIPDLADRVLDPYGQQDWLEYARQSRITVDRLNILEHLKNDDDASEFVRVPNSPYDHMNNQKEGFLDATDGGNPPTESELVEMNERFWNDMFDLGLNEYKLVQEEYLTDEVFPSHYQVREPVVETHRSLTEQIEQFYDMQANTYSVYYAMLDNFSYRFEGTEHIVSDEVAEKIETYTDEHQLVAEKLQPPEINEITVTPNRPASNFYNHAQISFSASHTHDVVEKSIFVSEDYPGVIQFNGGSDEEDAGISYGIDDYVSIGQHDEHTITTTRTAGVNFNLFDFNDPNFNTKNINMGLRVRGPAGTTAIRQANFQLDVGPNGESVDEGYNPLPDEEDIDPPEEPIAELDQVLGYNEEASEPAYWTNDPQVIEIQARARDTETGIDEIEYAIGSSPGEDDIVEWTMLPGVLDFVDAGYEQISSESVALDLEEDQEYYVSLRAINNVGLTSPEHHVQDPVRFDPNDPGIVQEDEFDESIASVLDFSDILSSFQLYTPVYDPVFESQDDYYEGFSLHDLPDSPRVNPKIAVTWTEAQDDVSGISHYEYLVTDSETASDMEFDVQTTGTTEDLYAVMKGGDGNPFEDVIESFRDEYIAHVRAVDYAGNTGAIATMEAQMPYDPMNPTAPIVQVRPKQNEFDLYVTGEPTDPESEIKGLQYSVGTSPGSSNVRSWPESDEVDFEFTQRDLSFDLLVINVESYSFSTDILTEGEEVYINYRSVNNQGRTSNTNSTGPVVLDNEPPDTPVITNEEVGYNYYTGMFTIQFEAENIFDPVSGIIDVEYQLSDGNESTDWVTLKDIEGVETEEITVSEVTHIPNNLEAEDTYVRVRATNALQLQSIGPQVLTYTPTW